jgi:hypothetical protein
LMLWNIMKISKQQGIYDALEDSSIATAHHGVQSHAVGGEPESTLRGLVSCGEEEILSSHSADNT